MRLILEFARRYPGSSLVVLAALIVIGLIEGLSLSTLEPALEAIRSAREPGAELSSDGSFIIDFIRGLGLDPTLGALLSLLVIGFVLKSGMLLLTNLKIGYTVAQVGTDLRLGLLRALLGARWEYYTRQPIGKLANAMSIEADRSSKAYLHGATVVTTIIQILVYIGLALAIDWRATVAYTTGALVLAFALAPFIAMTKRAGVHQTRLLKNLVSVMTDFLQSVKPLKAMSQERRADTVLETETRELNDALRMEVFSKEALKAIQVPTSMALIAVGVWVGLELWNMEFEAVGTLIILLARMFSAIGKAQQTHQKLVTCEASFWSLQETMQDALSHVEVLRGEREGHLRDAIRFEDVRFAYGETEVLRGIDLEIRRGELTALIGFSGAGKTTIIDLVTGLLRASSGRVSLDGIDMNEIDVKGWRSRIGYVPQENLLLHDSIFNNVTLGEEGLGEAEVRRALEQAGAWDFVAKIEGGMMATVGERGAKLSGGQRQRIMIARALVHQPELLLLDEATSALDPKSEAAICATMREFRGKLTILAISHQPAITEVADRVYRVAEGRATLDERYS